MQKDGDSRLKGTTLGMEKLYKHLFKSDLPGTVDTTLTQPIKHPLLLFFPGAHRALADVRAMKAIFTHLNCLDDVEIRSQKMAYKNGVPAPVTILYHLKVPANDIHSAVMALAR